MNGAESLVRTLVVNGVEVCFSNSGTSEVHFVAALEKFLRSRTGSAPYAIRRSQSSSGFAMETMR
jgi:thiamine pyrophosphate-dependent acetolactate synthase large subunit-like protein